MKINNKGLTIVELIVALGVMAVLMVFILQFFDQQKKMAREYEREVEQKIDTLLADKLVLKDFRAATPSINQLFVPDDNNNNFFDYEPDINNTAFYKETKKNRIITLNADSSNKIFYLLVVDQIK
jgi:prepilin-type N-terminal cleavage/methylation domain-containing protein